MNTKTEIPEKTIREAKKIVEIVGTSLGNLICEIFRGNIKKQDYNSVHLNECKGTRYYIIGGSIGTNGFTKEIIPLWAKKQINSQMSEMNNIEILPTYTESYNAGSIGASYAYTEEALKKIENIALESTKKTKIPVLPLIDIGGTKINLIFAHFNNNGKINNKILESYKFPTPLFTTPENFYKDIVSYIIPILNKYDNSDYEIIKIIGIGQPGYFKNSQSEIFEGAKDLGELIGVNPNILISQAFKDYQKDNYEFHFCNDGTAQFFGLIKNLEKNNEKLWKEMIKDKERVMYLGIGTGLGIGYGTISENRLNVNIDIRNANTFKVSNEFVKYLEQKYGIIKEIFQHVDKVYGNLVSSKLFTRYMHQIEFNSSSNCEEFYFLNETGIDTKNKTYLSNFLNVNKKRTGNKKKIITPLNSELINYILNEEITTVKTEVQFAIIEELLKKKLNDSFVIFSNEIRKTLKNNIADSDYMEIIKEIIKSKKRGNIIHFAGIGKSHLIGKNLAYIYNNLGIRSSYLELTGANSENLTNLKCDDLVFLISNSGKACELLILLDSIKEKGCITVTLSGDKDSYLSKDCDYFINTKAENQNPLSIKEAPTTSTTLALVAGTAVAIISSFYFDYNKKDFFLDHPALEFDKINFSGVKADPSFNPQKKLQDIFEKFANLIDEQKDYINFKNKTNKEFSTQILNLAKYILISYENKRTVFITGAGASYKVAEKIAATLTSIGIDAAVVNSAQLPHGDFAHIKKDDLLIVFSYSGETKQLMNICKIAKEKKKAEVALITSNTNPEISKELDIHIVNIKMTDDSKLVPIPDQKIMSSCINMVVGDALAIILETVLKPSTDMFAKEAHQGGAISREEDYHNDELLKKYADLNDFFVKYFENGALCSFDQTFNKNECDNCDYKEKKYCALQKEALHLVRKHLDQIGKNEYKDYKSLLGVFKNQLVEYNNKYDREPNKTGEVLIIGAGSIGITYIARILSLYKKTIHFVEENSSRIKNLKSKRYLLQECNNVCEINRFSVTQNSEIDKISKYALKNNLVFVSIGINNHKNIEDLIKYIVLCRYAFKINDPINFVFCENFPVSEKPLAELRHKIMENIKSPDVKIYFTENVGFVPSVDEVLAPVIKNSFNFVLPIIVEPNIPPLYVSKKEWKGNPDNNEISGCKEIKFVDDFKAYHMRKLWIHNMAHFLSGLHAKRNNIKYIYNAIKNKDIRKYVEEAIDSIGEVIYSRWDFDEFESLEEYKNWILKRYEYDKLEDTTERVLRDPIRKIQENDRIIGPLNYIHKYGNLNTNNCIELVKGMCLAIDLISHHEINNWKNKNPGKKAPRKLRSKFYLSARNRIKNYLLIDSENVIKAEKELKIIVEI